MKRTISVPLAFDEETSFPAGTSLHQVFQRMSLQESPAQSLFAEPENLIRTCLSETAAYDSGYYYDYYMLTRCVTALYVGAVKTIMAHKDSHTSRFPFAFGSGSRLEIQIGPSGTWYITNTETMTEIRLDTIVRFFTILVLQLDDTDPQCAIHPRELQYMLKHDSKFQGPECETSPIYNSG